MSFQVNNYKNLQASLLNNSLQTAPILDFSDSSEAKEKNLTAIEEFVNKNEEYLNSLPPLEYEYRYMTCPKDGVVDKNTLFKTALNEMDGEKEISVKDFENKYFINDEFTAQTIDINKDGKIDTSEYSTNILATDILSKESKNINSVDGTINSKGMNAILEYSKKSNAAAATKLYSEIYKTYKLGL